MVILIWLDTLPMFVRHQIQRISHDLIIIKHFINAHIAESGQNLDITGHQDEYLLF